MSQKLMHVSKVLNVPHLKKKKKNMKTVTVGHM